MGRHANFYLATSLCLQVARKESSIKMDQLHDAGATDILLFSIANSRM